MNDEGTAATDRSGWCFYASFYTAFMQLIDCQTQMQFLNIVFKYAEQSFKL